MVYRVSEEMEENDRLRMRIHFMSQPVGAPMNLPYARKMRDQFTGDKVRVHGFNRMTDGTIAYWKGELKEAYAGKDYIAQRISHGRRLKRMF